MTELQITKDELVEKLLVEEVTITFTKADGTDRTMLCTKQFSKIPQEFHPKTDKVVKLDESGNVIETDLISVWDLEKQGWRSFNFSKIKAIV
jgi:WYL_2, Sm-like SH3 beta-barrel fold